jgi:hypothetical protein
MTRAQGVRGSHIFSISFLDPSITHLMQLYTAALAAIFCAIASANSLGDTLAWSIYSPLTLGAYPAYKLTAHWFKCGKDFRQSYTACMSSDGCRWNPGDEQAGVQGKCYSGGFKAIHKDRDTRCKYVYDTDHKACNKDKMCYWKGSKQEDMGGACRARKLYTYRSPYKDSLKMKTYYEKRVAKMYKLGDRGFMPTYAEIVIYNDLLKRDFPPSEAQELCMNYMDAMAQEDQRIARIRGLLGKVNGKKK